MNLFRICIGLSLLCTPGVALAANTDQTMEYGTDAAWYYNYGLNPRMTSDWNLYLYKGECKRNDITPIGPEYQQFNYGAFRGLSGDYYRRMAIHGVLCDNSVLGFFDYYSFHPAPQTFESYDANWGPLPGGVDWDYGYEKLTCPENYYVSGVSQDSDITKGVHKIQCAKTALYYRRNESGCFAKVMGVDYNGYNHQSDGGATSDWDNGYQKAECPLGSAIAGVSRNALWDPNNGGGLHAILCCYIRTNYQNP